MVSHHNMVSPRRVSLQNGDNRGGLPPIPRPSDATEHASVFLIRFSTEMRHARRTAPAYKLTVKTN